MQPGTSATGPCLGLLLLLLSLIIAQRRHVSSVTQPYESLETSGVHFGCAAVRRTDNDGHEFDLEIGDGKGEHGGVPDLSDPMLEALSFMLDPPTPVAVSPSRRTKKKQRPPVMHRKGEVTLDDFTRWAKKRNLRDRRRSSSSAGGGRLRSLSFGSGAREDESDEVWESDLTKLFSEWQQQPAKVNDGRHAIQIKSIDRGTDPGTGLQAGDLGARAGVFTPAFKRLAYWVVQQDHICHALYRTPEIISTFNQLDTGTASRRDFFNTTRIVSPLETTETDWYLP